MKRILSVLLLCSLVALYGCQYTVDVLDKGVETEGVEELLSDDTEVNYAMDDGTTIDPETLVDTDGAVVRLLGISNTTEAPRIELAFSKGNREYVDFIVDYCLIDGWQVSGTAFPSAESFALSFQGFSREYKEFTGMISIITAPLVEYGLLDQIYDIEFGYRFIGPYDEMIAEGVYATTTSNKGEPAGFICDGPILLESDGIKVQLYSFEHGTYQGNDCEDLTLYVENDSDRRIELVIGDTEKYKQTDPVEEEETEDTRSVIARNEKNGKQTTSVPIYGDGNVCAGSRTLSKLQSADMEEAVTLSEDEELSFSLKIYDYEAYDFDNQSDPLIEETVTLTTEDMFTPD